MQVLRRAEESSQALTVAYPDVPQFERDLADAHETKGFTLAWKGDRSEALVAYQRAVQVRQRLAASHTGDPADRARLAKALYELATLFARDVRAIRPTPAALRDQEADKLAREALHNLRLAKRSGYFAGPQSRDRFIEDDDFAALRGRPDFKAFAASLDKP